LESLRDHAFSVSPLSYGNFLLLFGGAKIQIQLQFQLPSQFLHLIIEVEVGVEI